MTANQGTLLAFIWFCDLSLVLLFLLFIYLCCVARQGRHRFFHARLRPNGIAMEPVCLSVPLPLFVSNFCSHYFPIVCRLQALFAKQNRYKLASAPRCAYAWIQCPQQTQPQTNNAAEHTTPFAEQEFKQLQRFLPSDHKQFATVQPRAYKTLLDELTQSTRTETSFQSAIGCAQAFFDVGLHGNPLSFSFLSVAALFSSWRTFAGMPGVAFGSLDWFRINLTIYDDDFDFLMAKLALVLGVAP